MVAREKRETMEEENKPIRLARVVPDIFYLPLQLTFSRHLPDARLKVSAKMHTNKNALVNGEF